MPPHTLDSVTDRIIASSIDIHRTVGPGLLERAYEILLHRSLRAQGFRATRQHAVTFWYDGIEIRKGFRVDIPVEEIVVVDIKSLPKIKRVQGKQVVTYVRLMKLPLGLLINFGQATLREGLRRIVNGLDPQKSPLLRVNRLSRDVVNIPGGDQSALLEANGFTHDTVDKLQPDESLILRDSNFSDGVATRLQASATTEVNKLLGHT